jgi:hypothetical protein
VTFGPGADGDVGGYAFARMDKDNFQNILAAINGFTGQEVRRIEESGEINVLYVGRNTAPPATASDPAAPSAAAPPATAGVSAAVPAAALPPRSDNVVNAAPLPPSASALQPLVLLNKGVQWTDRAGGSVGFVWAAEVGNDNAVELESVVVLRLLDASGAILYEARQPVTVPAGDVFAFTTEGEVPEAQAERADRWTFDVQQPATPAATPVASDATDGHGAIRASHWYGAVHATHGAVRDGAGSDDRTVDYSQRR